MNFFEVIRCPPAVERTAQDVDDLKFRGLQDDCDALRLQDRVGKNFNSTARARRSMENSRRIPVSWRNIIMRDVQFFRHFSEMEATLRCACTFYQWGVATPVRPTLL